jgi:hypothetical protein
MHFSLINLLVTKQKEFHRERKTNVICGISIKKYREFQALDVLENSLWVVALDK